MYLIPLKYWAIAISALILVYFSWQTAAKLRSQPQATTNSNQVTLSENYYSVAIPSTEKNQYLSAEYSVWIPAEIERVRGVLVKQHGCGAQAAASGLDHTKDLQWQALAAKHQFALMGTKLLVEGGRCEDWALINYGSKDLFLEALDTVARQSQREELKNVPWVLWGHSGGADWAAQMLQEYPERTLAMVALRGGGFVFLGINQQLAEIPVMFSLGEKDRMNPYETKELPQTIFHRYRKLNALWSLAIEAGAGHETGNARSLAIPYLDAVINIRLAKDTDKLLAIDRRRGWLGNIVTGEIASADQYQGDGLEAAWLPDESTARKWQQYVTSGKVSSSNKPHAPTDIEIKKAGFKGVSITWNYTPDLENGLPSFRIYRDDSLLQTIPGQTSGFGDNPKPIQVTLAFRDRQGSVNSSYRVAAVNELGESLSPSQKVRQEL